MIVEHKIGERFELDKIIYETRESDYHCGGCACYIPDENICTDRFAFRFGSCIAYDRKDGKDVIFVKVKEVED